MANVIIAENCRKVSEVPMSDLKKVMGARMKDGLYDTRHDIFSLNNTSDMQMYYNYLETIKEIAQGLKRGKLDYMLDLGYMPVLMPPFFAENLWYNSVTKALEEHKIPYKKLAASSFSKDNYSSDVHDIWVSKLDCVDLLGKPATSIRVRDLLEAIL